MKNLEVVWSTRALMEFDDPVTARLVAARCEAGLWFDLPN
jgi:hypothetical protein